MTEKHGNKGGVVVAAVDRNSRVVGLGGWQWPTVMAFQGDEG